MTVPDMHNEEAITVRGARVNNLKQITFEIPLNSLTVVTGVSGSGKSSLAFDTVYAEGQRRYVESLSAYARQFLERMEKPDVDEVIGICPAVAISQKNSTRNPRSTVGTQTEIYDYLRLLFARAGTTICYNCGQEVKRDTPQAIAERVLQEPEGTRFYVLFPAEAGLMEKLEKIETSGKKAAKKKVSEHVRLSINAHLMSLMQRGFIRLYDATKNEIIELQTPDSFTGNSFEDIYVLVDRMTVRQGDEAVRSRLVTRWKHVTSRDTGKRSFNCLAQAAILRSNFLRNFRAKPATLITCCQSRSSSALTIHSVRVRRVRVSEIRLGLILIWSFRIKICRWRKARSKH
jgi:excinuclease UvrABC ATPase subunit